MIIIYYCDNKYLTKTTGKHGSFSLLISFWTFTKLPFSYLWRKCLWIMMTSLGKPCLQNHVAAKICDEVKWPQGKKMSFIFHHDKWYTSVRYSNRLKFIIRMKKLKFPHFSLPAVAFFLALHFPQDCFTVLSMWHSHLRSKQTAKCSAISLWTLMLTVFRKRQCLELCRIPPSWTICCVTHWVLF